MFEGNTNLNVDENHLEVLYKCEGLKCRLWNVEDQIDINASNIIDQKCIKNLGERLGLKRELSYIKPFIYILANNIYSFIF